MVVITLAGNVILCVVGSSTDLTRHIASDVGDAATFHVNLETQPTRHIANMSANVCHTALFLQLKHTEKQNKRTIRVVVGQSPGIALVLYVCRTPTIKHHLTSSLYQIKVFYVICR